jgi:iron complex transport system substrate-binding protein
MRIVSLVPSATEMLFALGLGDAVVGVTHECDHPTEALDLPQVTRDRIPAGLSPKEIDEAVREMTLGGESIYELDDELLEELEPDLIVTQELCAVCAVSADDVRKLAERLDPVPRVIALDPRTVGEVLGDVGVVARAADALEAGASLVADAGERIDMVRAAVADAERPRVLALEWLDPPYVAGHWTPQLIEYAGGEDVLGLPGEHSQTFDWETLAATQPDVVVVMPCGYDALRAVDEAVAFEDRLRSLGARRVVAVNAAAYFSRPGPRLVDGLEVLARVLHPDRVREAPTEALEIEL